MRWQKKVVCATNATRGTMLGEHIRVAETGLETIIGLLGERELPPGDGLLIVPSQGIHTWGMRFAIDVVVLDDAWKVIAVRRDVRPFRMTRVFWNAAAVLELQSGIVDSSGTQVDDVIQFSRADESVD
jgi:uncharacterized membrane protein (UPF0127 family)